MAAEIKFYDTNILLSHLDSIEGHIYLSSITLEEIENIKTSTRKDQDVKFEARRATRWLRENEDRYTCVAITDKQYKILKKFKVPETNDNLIIASAYLLDKKCTFVTDDICCYNLAKNVFGLDTETFDSSSVEDIYCGYKEVEFTQQQLADFYSGKRDNKYGLLTNEYLLLRESGGFIVDAQRWNGEDFIPVSQKGLTSKTLGKLTFKDWYQACVVDSMFNNKITMVKGKAGTGKSLLAMNYLFYQLDKHAIEKIVIFCNPTKVRGAEELGFYTGNKDEKLLQNNIGTFLASKLGDMMFVEELIFKNKLVLLPISDIRGFDTTGMKCGVYITEAQNMSIDMAKLALQRIGEDCICILDGDYTSQVDSNAYSGSNNGMRRVSEIFRGEDIYGEIELKNTYRSRIAEICEKM